MSHWFHRNPIKASIKIDFDKRSYPSSSEAHNLCSLAKRSRENLLDIFSDSSNSVEKAQTEFQTYVSLLYGFIYDVSGRTTGDSKLRFSFKSKWTESLGSSYTQ